MAKTPRYKGAEFGVTFFGRIEYLRFQKKKKNYPRYVVVPLLNGCKWALTHPLVTCEIPLNTLRRLVGTPYLSD